MRDEGFEVETAATLAEARVVAPGLASPDVVLVDLRLPDGSGLDLLRELDGTRRGRDRPHHRQRARVDSAVEALRQGASDYLTKPVDVAAAAVGPR